MTEETIPQMRETIDRLVKDNKSLTAERDTAVGEVRSLNARSFASAANFTPQAGELYAKNTEGDLTADGFAEFATGLGLTASEAVPPATGGEAPAAGEETTPEATGSADLSNMARGGSTTEGGAGSATEESMTRDEWIELSRTDPIAAKEALAKGKVLVSKDNPYAGGSQRPGNPFQRGQQ